MSCIKFGRGDPMKFRKQLVFLFGCIALITYLSIHFSQEEDERVALVSTQERGAQIQLYLKDQDQMLVPLSIDVNEEMNEEDKLQIMISYMSGKQKMEGFQALFTKQCNLERVQIEEGVAHLYFDEGIKNYKKQDELRVLEAITWGTTQFKEVKQVILYCGETRLTQMPQNNTPIPEVLNRTIGINHFETSTTQLHRSTTLTVFASKQIQGKEYLVPRSRRVYMEGDALSYSVQAILDDVSSSSELLQPLYNQQIEIEGHQLNDGILTLNLNKSILSSDKSVKQNIYDTLVLSLGTLDSVERVELKVDGSVVTLKDQNEQAVSKYDLRYNIVQF